MVHCDVKPLNIIIQSPGKPRLIDLGASRYLDERLEAEDVVVSVPYSAPVLWTGDPVDGRADIFSLGMTLLHMLVGLPHFADDPYDTMPVSKDFLGSGPGDTMIRNHISASLREIGPSLRPVLQKAGAPEADDRYTDMEELLMDLGDFSDKVL